MTAAEQLAVLDESIRNQEGELGFYSASYGGYQQKLAELNKAKADRDELVAAIAAATQPQGGAGGADLFHISSTGTSKYIWYAVGAVAVLGFVAFMLRRK